MIFCSAVTSFLWCYSWFDCPFCLKRYLQHADAAAHVVACPSREPDMACDVREGWDARHPLLVVWSLGMGLPFLKEGGSGDAQMLVRNNPEQVWECAKNSREIKFRR